MVEVFLERGGERIAVHRRKAGRNQYATTSEHMPETLAEFRTGLRESVAGLQPQLSGTPARVPPHAARLTPRSRPRANESERLAGSRAAVRVRAEGAAAVSTDQSAGGGSCRSTAHSRETPGPT